MAVSLYSSTYLLELEPFFLLQVDGVTLPPHMMKQVDFIKLEEAEGEKARLEFTIKDPTAETFDTPLFKFGQMVNVLAGYRTMYELRGKFEIVGIEYEMLDKGVKFKIKGEEGGKLASNAARRVFSEGSVRDVFMRVAAENDLEFNEQEAPGLDTVLSSDFPVIQGGENDGAFLQKIAAELGYSLVTTSGKLIVTEADYLASLGVITLDFRNAKANLMGIKAKHKKPSVSWVPITQVTQQPFQLEQQLLLPDLPHLEARDFVQDQNRADRDANRVEYDVAIAELENSGGSYTEIQALRDESLEQHRQSLDKEDLELRLLDEKFAQDLSVRQDQQKKEETVDSALEDARSNLESAEEELEFAGGWGVPNEEELAEVAAAEQEYANALAKVEQLERAQQITNAGALAPDFSSDGSDPAMAQELYGAGFAQSQEGQGNLLGAEKQRKEVTKTIQEERVVINDVTGEVEVIIVEREVTETIEVLSIPYDPADRMAGDAAQVNESIPKRKVIREGKLEEVMVMLKLGSMVFRPKTLVVVEGVGEKIGGDYRVTRVLHTFDGQFGTELTLKRRKPPASLAEESLQTGVPLGMELNENGELVVAGDHLRDPSVSEVFMFSRDPNFYLMSSGTDELAKGETLVKKVVIGTVSGEVEDADGYW